MKKIVRGVVRDLVIVFAAAIIGMLLIMASYLIPIENIKLNEERGSEVLLGQTEYYIYAGDYTSTVLDNHTDAIILAETAYRGESILENAVYVPYRGYLSNDSDFYNLFSYFHDDPDGVEAHYPRYWHGYVTILKPFFYFLDYNDFKIINQIVQLTLIFIAAYLFIKRGKERYLIAFIPMILFWNPATIGVSLQYAPCFYVSMLALIALFNSRCNKDNAWIIFILAGILTAYLDFLTYPICTLGIPLVVYFIMYSKDESGLFGEIKKLVELSFHWGIGYAGMWSMKWILGSIMVGENIIGNAISQAEIHSSSENMEFSRVGVVWFILRKSFLRWPYLIMTVVVLALIVYLGMHVKIKIERATLIKTMIFIAIALLPIVWYLLVPYHTWRHPRLVYRNLGIALFSGFAWFISIIETGKKMHD